MPPVSFLGVVCTGHDCHPPRPLTATKVPTVLVNGNPIATLGDPLAEHACGRSHHPGAVAVGSGTVFAGGNPVARIGDMVSCGSALAIGSPNVLAGG